MRLRRFSRQNNVGHDCWDNKSVRTHIVTGEEKRDIIVAKLWLMTKIEPNLNGNKISNFVIFALCPLDDVGQEHFNREKIILFEDGVLGRN